MSNEKINEAIAKACGWKQINIRMGLATVWVDPSGNKQEKFPDYCNDSWALREAEKTLSQLLENAKNKSSTKKVDEINH